MAPTLTRAILRKEAMKKIPNRWKYFKMVIKRSKCYRVNEYQHFGKKFINQFRFKLYKGRTSYLLDLGESEFEAPVSVALFSPNNNKHEMENKKIFEIRLGFKKNIIEIKSIQGRYDGLAELRDFERIVGEPTANHIIKEIELQAKKLGYKTITIPNPKTLDWYKSPILEGSLSKKGKNLFYKYFRKERITEEEEIELTKELEKARDVIRERMRKLYYSIAVSLKYKRRDSLFIKKL